MFAVWAWQRQIREKPEETQAVKSKRLVYRAPNQKGIGGGSEPLGLSALREGLRHTRKWATRDLSGRPPWRAGASGARDGGPSGTCLIATL